MAATRKPTKKSGSASKKKAAPARKAPARKAPARAKSSAAKKPARKAAAPARRKAPLKGKRPAATKPRRPVRKPARVTLLKENPEALALARAIARVALDKKAAEVLIIDTRLRGSAVGYDYIVLASGDSDRQLSAIADAVDEALKPAGQKPLSVESSADWVLLNHGDVVTHLFTPEKRATYDLEGLWADVPRVPLTAKA